MADPRPETTPANDDAMPSPDAISLTDLAAMSGSEEDTLLQRLAGILNRRIEGQTDAR